jgi:penicillin-binding protein 1A
VRRRRLWLRRVALVCAVLLGLAALAIGLAYRFALPGVGDAEARLEAIVQTHHGTIGHVSTSSRLAAATVAVEDDRFYDNTFLNVLYGVARAAAGTLRGGGDAGGSTIAQQLAKQLYGTHPGLVASLEELGLGVKLSTSYSRGQVLNMYLNAAYFGNGYWGAGAAARGYFGVAPSRLTWSEAAMLAGLLQAPSAYDPLQHLVLARERERHVLDRLVADGRLSAAAARVAYHAPLPLQLSR